MFLHKDEQHAHDLIVVKLQSAKLTDYAIAISVSYYLPQYTPGFHIPAPTDRHLKYDSWYHSLSCLSLSCALFRIYSGWSIPIFSNWWMSLKPKRSTSSFLNCEFRCLMSWVQRPPACLFWCSDLLNFVCWLYPPGEWAVIAWGLVDVRTALFRYDGLRAALFSSACVAGELQCISVDMLCVCPILGGFFIYRFSDSGQNEND